VGGTIGSVFLLMINSRHSFRGSGEIRAWPVPCKGSPVQYRCDDKRDWGTGQGSPVRDPCTPGSLSVYQKPPRFPENPYISIEIFHSGYPDVDKKGAFQEIHYWNAFSGKI